MVNMDHFMALARDNKSIGEIVVTSLVSGRTFQPLVQITWGDQSGQLSLIEARDHAMAILEAAEAAESDAFVFQWLTQDIIGTTEDEKANWNQIIQQFKEFREARTKLKE